MITDKLDNVIARFGYEIIGEQGVFNVAMRNDDLVFIYVAIGNKFCGPEDIREQLQDQFEQACCTYLVQHCNETDEPIINIQMDLIEFLMIKEDRAFCKITHDALNHYMEEADGDD